MYTISSFSSLIITKRTMLFEISEIFDSLGLLGPCILKIKVILQAPWREQLSWDDPLLNNIKTEWLNFRSKVTTLNELMIAWHVLLKHHTHVQLTFFQMLLFQVTVLVYFSGLLTVIKECMFNSYVQRAGCSN